MNSRERFQAAMDLQEPDLVPVAPMVNVPHASKVLGVKPWEYVTDNELYVKGQLAALEKYKYDWIFNHQPIQGVTEKEKRSMETKDGYVVLPTELGPKLKIPLEGGPAVVEPALKDYSTLDELEVPDFSSERMKPLATLLELTKDKVYICSKVPAPFHYAAEWMRGMENFMFDLVTSPRDAHKLLDFMADIAIEVGKRQIDTGTHGIMMEDPSAACQVISHRHYREFAYPYEKKVCSALGKYGGSVIIHICGDTSEILGELATTGARCLSIDESVPLEQAREKVGSKVALFGNVSVELIFKGSKEDIDSKVKECIQGAGKKGYIVSSSCGLHSGTPFENIHALVEAARKYGS